MTILSEIPAQDGEAACLPTDRICQHTSFEINAAHVPIGSGFRPRKILSNSDTVFITILH
jgi:hypothetical protein